MLSQFAKNNDEFDGRRATHPALAGLAVPLLGSMAGLPNIEPYHSLVESKSSCHMLAHLA